MEQFILQLGIMSLQACIIIGVVLLVREIFSRAGIAKKYINILWMLPYVCMICPWKFEGAFGFWRQPQSDGSKYATQELLQALRTLKDGASNSLAEQVLETTTETLVNTEASAGLAGGQATGLLSTPLSNTLNGDVLQMLLAMAGVVWLVGVIGLILYSADAHLKLHRKLICCMHAKENIYIADDIKVPFVLGIFKPRIYLPGGMSELDKQYVVAHEKTHIRHLDPLKKAIVFGITCLHWFNPLAWVAFHFYSKDMEMACDEETVQQLGMEHRQSYATTLLSLATGKRLFLGAPLAFDEGNVKSRVKNIVKYKKTWKVLSVVAVAMIVVLTVGFMTKEGAKNVETRELTMEELIELFQAGTETLGEVMQWIPFGEEGAIYTNLDKSTNDYEGVLNQNYFCYLSHEDKDYRLQLSYSKEDNTLWDIYLYYPAADDIILLYTHEPERYTVNNDIKEFLSRKYNMDDYFTCTLPEGTQLGNFKMLYNDIFHGCPILGDYEEPPHGSGTIAAWYLPGCILIGDNDEHNDRMQFKNGKAVSVRWLGNHMGLSEKCEVVEGCEMQALLYEVGFDLFTAAESYDYMQEHKLAEGELQTVSKYWYVFMGEEDSEYIYVVGLNQEYFTKEEVIELARSVRITYE